MSCAVLASANRRAGPPTPHVEYLDNSTFLWSLLRVSLLGRWRVEVHLFFARCPGSSLPRLQAREAAD